MSNYDTPSNYHDWVELIEDHSDDPDACLCRTDSGWFWVRAAADNGSALPWLHGAKVHPERTAP